VTLTPQALSEGCQPAETIQQSYSYEAIVGAPTRRGPHPGRDLPQRTRARHDRINHSKNTERHSALSVPAWVPRTHDETAQQMEPRAEGPDAGLQDIFLGKTEPHAARPGNLRRRHAVVVEGSYINVNGSRHAALRVTRSNALENLCD
jgi:hypothetical protein